ncbi:MAG: cation diffusion facilitator family transporter [Trueperaceae bacterium]|nr:cation diffusion facilitator family transporter [Trueperaceae bacterium]
MDHNHHHTTSNGNNYGLIFGLGIGLNLTYVIVEATFGFLSGSLSLVADAGHNLSDVLGLVAAWTAYALAKRSPSGRFTYGLKRSPILASLFNALLLLVAMGAISYEAVQRLFDPAPLAGTTIIVVASVGIVINAGTALLLMRGQKDDLNMRGAFLHMVADAAVTVGVVIAGVAIVLTGWLWLDPAISLLIVAAVLWSTWGLLRDSVYLSLDAVPDDIELGAVRTFLQEQQDVTDVHDLHVWPLSTTETALSVHLVLDEAPSEPNVLIAELCEALRERFGIGHSTVQIEAGEPSDPCGLTSAETV